MSWIEDAILKYCWVDGVLWSVKMNQGIMFTEALLLDMVLQKSIWSSSASIMLKILKQSKRD